jgi:hypothetical protein
VSNGRSQGSSVSIGTDYELNNRAIEVLSLAEAKEDIFSNLSVSRPTLGPTQPPV